VSAGSGWAQSDQAAPAGAEWVLPALPTWTAVAAVETAVGFKDNLVLSADNEERSSFARGGVEFLIMRVPTGPLELSLFGQADGTRFLTGEAIKDERKLWLHAEAAYRLGSRWKVTLPATGYYDAGVFDQSATDAERIVAELQVKGLMVSPAVRWDFKPGWWLEAQASGERKRYDDGANDGEVCGQDLRLGWSPAKRLELRLKGVRRWRSFESRALFNAAGRELVGTELKVDEREVELRADVGWDRAGHWRTTTRVGLLHYRDNGSGYFNYRDLRATQDVEWKRGDWLVRLETAVNRIEFGVQTVGLGLAPPARVKDEYEAALRVERQWSARVAVFGDYRWERSRCNDAIASYRVNECLLGVRWSWER